MLASRLRNITTIKELKHEIAYGESLGAKANCEKKEHLSLDDYLDLDNYEMVVCIFLSQ